ncbi:MAG: DUF1593 domain-containing protein [Bacteroidales bacterium]|nr:DUF1593 domain-containing protein [Bacteroidales bacterium]
MKITITLLTLILLTVACSAQSRLMGQSDKPRLIVMADMGNEPDEEQQMLHLLMYSDKVDIEGLIAVSGLHLRPGQMHAYRRRIHPELFDRLVQGYEKVYNNLHKHADGWISPFNLRLSIVSGQTEYGIDGIGDGKFTEGSELIIRQVTRDDPRPVFIVVNAGSGTLAQALYDYRKNHSPGEVAAFVAKIRVMENGAQDNSGAWITHEFPDIHWVRMNFQNRGYGGPSLNDVGPHVWKPYTYSTKGQDDWAHEHIRTGHGALGELYPMRLFFTHTFERPEFIEGGGTIPWLSLVTRGLTDPSEPSWGGWSGRYSAEKKLNVTSLYKEIAEDEQRNKPWMVYTDAVDHWIDPETGKEYNDEYTAIWPWRQAMWNDFRARMDWCVKPFEESNHNPIAVVNGDATDAIIFKDVKPGETLSFDASASTDPDKDKLQFKWWVYEEAGRNPYGKSIPIQNPANAKIDFKIPGDAQGKEVHLILEVWDRSKIVPLVDYRRVVMSVK